MKAEVYLNELPKPRLILEVEGESIEELVHKIEPEARRVAGDKTLLVALQPGHPALLNLLSSHLALIVREVILEEKLTPVAELDLEVGGKTYLRRLRLAHGITPEKP